MMHDIVCTLALIQYKTSKTTSGEEAEHEHFDRDEPHSMDRTVERVKGEAMQ